MKAVLVLDDDASVRTAVVESLRHAGFDALAAGVDLETLEDLSRAPELLGLILLDAATVKAQASDFVEIVRSTFPRLPVVGMSAHGKRLGAADGFIAKPLRLDVLLSVAHEFCG